MHSQLIHVTAGLCSVRELVCCLAKNMFFPQLGSESFNHFALHACIVQRTLFQPARFPELKLEIWILYLCFVWSVHQAAHRKIIAKFAIVAFGHSETRGTKDLYSFWPPKLHVLCLLCCVAYCQRYALPLSSQGCPKASVITCDAHHWCTGESTTDWALCIPWAQSVPQIMLCCAGWWYQLLVCSRPHGGGSTRWFHHTHFHRFCAGLLVSRAHASESCVFSRQGRRNAFFKANSS